MSVPLAGPRLDEAFSDTRRRSVLSSHSSCRYALCLECGSSSSSCSRLSQHNPVVLLGAVMLKLSGSHHFVQPLFSSECRQGISTGLLVTSFATNSRSVADLGEHFFDVLTSSNHQQLFHVHSIVVRFSVLRVPPETGVQLSWQEARFRQAFLLYSLHTTVCIVQARVSVCHSGGGMSYTTSPSFMFALRNAGPTPAACSYRRCQCGAFAKTSSSITSSSKPRGTYRAFDVTSPSRFSTHLPLITLSVTLCSYPAAYDPLQRMRAAGKRPA